MKRNRKVLAIALTLAMVLHTWIGGTAVHAENPVNNDYVTLTAEKSGDTATLKLTTAKLIEGFGGLDLGDNAGTTGVVYDEDIFTYKSSSMIAGNGGYFDETKRFTLGTDGSDVPAGTDLFVLNFTVGSGYTAGETYSFTFNFSEAYNYDLDDYEDWRGTSLTVTLHEHVLTRVEAKAADCEKDGNTAYYTCPCGHFFSDAAGENEIEENSWVIPATGHAYGAPTYEWEADNSKVTAKKVCANNAEHVISETVNTTSVVTAPTCEEGGYTTYTATFTNSDFTTQTKKADETEATGHDWNAPTYEWTADNSKVTATRVCKNDPEHVETETVSTASVVTAPTCEEGGYTTYTATFTNSAFTTQTKKANETAATGHAWGAVTYEWAADNSKVTATRTCTNDASHVETETVSATSKVTKEATCEEAGETTWTSAAFENSAFAVQTKTTPIEATGHAWGTVTYEWAADNSSVKATRTCGNDATHIETETVSATSKVTKEPTCEEDGETTWTSAAFENSAFAVQTKTTSIAKLGHDWDYDNIEWTWTAVEGGFTAKATLTCKRDDSHTLDLDATMTGPVEGTYTATVTGPDGNTYTDTKTGHKIIITDYTKGKATTTVDPDELYSGSVTFTVNCNVACVLAIDNGDETYTRLTCTTVSDDHTFTVTVDDEDVYIVMLIKGDASLDSAINSKDLTIVTKASGGVRPLTALELLAADVNVDGKMNSKDITVITQVSGGVKTMAW